MFHTLDTTWDQSARRGWTAFASFVMQALAVSLLLFIPLLTIEGPPRLAWFDPHLLAPPPAPPAPAPAPEQSHPARAASETSAGIVSPPSIPHGIAPEIDTGIPAAPDVIGLGVPGGTCRGHCGFTPSIGEALPLAPPPPPAATRPLRVSHWDEGNLIHRVQPTYPLLARQARIQGSVELRAIISKTGTIENLTVLRGHAMLVTAALEAVKQWRYCPYLLNGEPIEVETEITVNFTLAAN